jgi:hypothetical protein
MEESLKSKVKIDGILFILALMISMVFFHWL